MPHPKRTERLIKKWRAIVEANPQDVKLRQGLAENLSYAERIADSIVEYEKALNLKPEDPVVHAGLVWQCIWEETALTWSQHRIKDEKLLKKDIEGLKNAENWNHRMLFMITL